MKKAPLKLLFVLSLLINIPVHVDAQFFERLAKHAEAKAKQEADNRAQKRVDNGIDKGFDAIEESIDANGNSDKKAETKIKPSGEGDQKNSGNNPSDKKNTNGDKNLQEEQKPTVVWNKYDFVPGDIVIFEDGPGAGEENGEFPSRWDLVKGQVEIANLDGENVMMFANGNPMITPYLKNAKEDYLPDVFTIEFDFYRPAKGNRVSVYLYDYKNQKNNPNMYMDISYRSISEKSSKVTGEQPDFDYTWNEKPRWIHVSIAFTEGKLKVYMDDTRLINIPHFEGNPSGLTLQAYWADLGKNLPFYFKNIRIAKGGVKYYDRILSEGRIIVNGIKFDVNKATLKPESMGPINNIYDLMVKNPDLNFSVEGHTDSDGDDASNMTLSKARGKAVMDKLISMGIAPNHLKSTGFGESKPIGENGTPEGKANNRRVEFVKF